MTSEVVPSQTPRPIVRGFSRSPTVDSPSFQVVLALVLDNPLLGAKQLAELTGRSPQFVKALLRSDVFQSKLQEAVAKRYGDKKGQLRLELLELGRKGIKAASAMIDNQQLTPAELISMLREILPQIAAAAVPLPQQPQSPVTVNVHGAFVPSSVLMEARLRAERSAVDAEVVSDNLKPLETLDDPNAYRPRPSLPTIEDFETTYTKLMEGQAGEPAGEETRAEVRGSSPPEADKTVPRFAHPAPDTGRGD